MVSTLAQNARDMGLIPALGELFPIVTTPMTLVDVILYKLHVVWLLHLSSVYIYIYIYVNALTVCSYKHYVTI